MKKIYWIVVLSLAVAGIALAQVAGTGSSGLSGVITPGNRVRRSGDTMSGTLTLAGTAAPALDVAGVGDNANAIRVDSGSRIAWAGTSSDILVTTGGQFTITTGGGNPAIDFLVQDNDGLDRIQVDTAGQLDLLISGTALDAQGAIENTSSNNGGDVAVTENIRNTSTTATFLIRSAIAAADATAATASVAVQPVNALDAGDSMFSVINSAGTQHFSVTQAGVAEVFTNLRLGGGTNGTSIGASFRSSTTIDFASLTAPNCADSSNITQTGATAGTECLVGPPATASPAGSVYTCIATSSAVVIVRHCCVVGTCDPASGAFAVRTFN